MAKEAPDWSSGHREAVSEIEKELGREICGVPTGSGLPCKKWPVDSSHGRCSDHAPDLNPEPSRVEVTSCSNDSSSQASSTIFSRFLNLPVIIVLVLSGLIAGFVLSAGIIYALGSENLSLPGETEPDRSGSSPATSTGSLDFEEINRLFESGEYGRLEEKLDHQLAAGEGASREDALYYLFVLYQRTERYRAAIDVGEKFVEEFPDHARAPEVLFGQAKIAVDFLGNQQLADKYYDQLEEEYPESRWIEKASALL